MSLISLQKYASRQTELIRSLVDPSFPDSHFRIPKDKFWLLFWQSAWHKKDLDFWDTTHKVKRGSGSNAIDHTIVSPDAVPHKCAVMTKLGAAKHCWSLKCEKILIRSEYREAEKFLMTVCGATIAPDVVVVIGQPGIGKSTFLLRILLRRLALGLPTALQVKPKRALLFYQGGVKEFTQLEDGPTYNSLESETGPMGRIWALVDTNPELREPALVFQAGPFFVVEASYPHPSCYGWTSRVRTKFFYMKPWSFLEVLLVRSLIEPSANEQSLWHLHHTYGASLRSLFLFINDVDNYDRLVSRELNRLDAKGLCKLFQDVANAEDNSHYLISTGPSNANPSKPELNFSSKYLLERVCKQVLGNRVEEMRMLYDILLNEGNMSSAAWMLFHHRVHQYLREGRILQLFPIFGKIQGAYVDYEDYGATNAGGNGKQVTLPDLPEIRFEGELNALRPGYYYRPRNQNFPELDSWLLTEPTSQEPSILLRFQITLNQGRCGTKKSGLSKLDKLVHADAMRCLIVVTPSGKKPKIPVSRDYLTDKFLGGRNPSAAFPVYHLPLSDDELFSRHPRPATIPSRV